MGCCESRHDASQFQSMSRPHSFDPSLGGDAMEAVSRAASAIRMSASKTPEPSALRDMRLALLSLPREAANVPAVPESEVFEVLSSLKDEAENSDLMLTGLVLMRYLAQRQENQKKMAKAASVSLVLTGLQKHASNPTLQGVACDTLGNLLQSEENSAQFLVMNGVDAVFKVIKQNMAHTRVMEAACFLLGNVASTEAGLKHIERLQGGTVALKVIKSHDDDAELLRELLFLLSNMAQSPNLQQELLRSGAVDEVLSVLKQHEISGEVQAMGCCVLDNLSSATSTNGGQCVSGDAADLIVSACVKAMDRHKRDGAVVKRAASCIATLALKQPKTQSLSPPLSSGTVDGLVGAAKGVLGDANAVQQVMRALEVMSAQPGNQVIIVDSEDVVGLIGDVIAKHCDGVIGKGGGGGKLACAGRALSLAAKLAETAEISGCRAVPAASLVPIISSALAMNWSQVSVVIPSCTVLASLAKAKSEGEFALGKVDPVLWEEALEGLIKALRARPGDMTVAVSASVAIAWICDGKCRPKGTIVADLMSAFVMVMRAHPKDADVAEAACFMFKTVAKPRDEAVADAVIKSGAPLLIVMVLRLFSSQAPGPESEGVLRRAMEALQVVGLEEASTAGAVKLAGAPGALEAIVESYPGTELSSLASSLLEGLN